MTIATIPGEERTMAKVDLDRCRRRDLAQFLRRARARVAPEAVGIVAGRRRRTAGLRREEVAELAGVSSIWYTWLEQGREVQPSDRLLTALSEALKLTTSEREYLHRLGREVRPEPVLSLTPPSALRRLLTQLPGPAMLADHRWNVVECNADLMALLPPITGDGPVNLIHTVFRSPELRRVVVDWASLARVAVSAYHMSYARNVDDPVLVEDITRLRAESSDFADLWGEQIVDADASSCVSIRHATAGTLRFNLLVLRTFERREANLVSMAPADAASANAWRVARGRQAPTRGVREVGSDD